MNQSKNIVIIGAGLTGLSLAYFLSKTNHKVTILEARERLGGRIHTLNNLSFAPIELGATWFSKQHTESFKLLKELKLELFEQILGDTAIYEPASTSPPQIVQLPKNQEPSYRVKGGTQQLINSLVGKINDKDILQNTTVLSIKKIENQLVVETNQNTLKTDLVVSTLPPHLLINTINFEPGLETNLKVIAKECHTWMGESIKFGFNFETPFWREKNLSGTLFSNVGPVPEMYDHSNEKDSMYALKGFLNGNYYKLSKEDRCELILKQLEKYYGKQVRNYTNYQELIWKKEPFTSSEYDDLVLPHQNNGHSVFQTSYLDHKLFIAGTETSINYSGYMEGAIRSAQNTFNKITME